MKRTISSTIINNKKYKCEATSNIPSEVPPIFNSLRIHILPAHFAKGRLNIFINQIKKYGGQTVPLESEDVSYIIVDESIDVNKLQKLMDVSQYSNIPVVKCSWISRCLKEKCLSNIDGFSLVKPALSTCQTTDDTTNSDKLHDVNSKQLVNSEKCMDNIMKKTIDYDGNRFADDRKQQTYMLKSETSESTAPKEVFVNKFQSKFACAHSSTSSANVASVNSHITAELKKLLKVYQSKNDTWRVAGYQKAISALQNHPTEIKSYEEALSIRGIGEKLAAKVWEIVNSGKLRKVEEVCGSEETEAISQFLGVWGAGAATANAWYAQGYRTIEDLKKCPNLTRHQKIGVRLYNDLNDRIPRYEVHAIHAYVHACCEELRAGLLSEVCGSYRRGRASCGDVDVLITHPDGTSHEEIFMPLLQVMKKKGFLTDDLVTQENNGSQQKYLGVCKLPGPDTKHRRLDIIVVPYAEYAPALMYFTGSAHFNRSMRLLATKLGMSLSEHGLRKNIVRQGFAKLNDGLALDTPTEESIFVHLGLPYRAPHERDH